MKELAIVAALFALILGGYMSGSIISQKMQTHGKPKWLSKITGTIAGIAIGAASSFLITGALVKMGNALPKSEENQPSPPVSAATQPSPQPDATDNTIVRNSGWDSSVRQVVDYLKENLNDPKSYEGIEWSKVHKEGNLYLVRHKYRAKNGFGALVIEHKIFWMDSQGKVMQVTNYEQ